jgi:EpsI family protein
MSGVRLGAVGVLMMLFAIGSALHGATTPPRPESHLAAVPLRIDRWRGQNDPPLEEDVAAVLRADEYLLRTYGEAPGPPVGLYIAFYGSQQTGATIHSPLNCLPGTGWDPVERGRVNVTLPGGELATVNRYVVQKGLDRQAVFYWFQSRNRVVASEYTSKLFLVRDSMLSGRSDGAIVRLSVPLRGPAFDADRAALDFLGALYPVLTRYLPA